MVVEWFTNLDFTSNVVVAAVIMINFGKKMVVLWFASGGGDVMNCYSRSIPNCFYREFQYWYHLVLENEFDSYGNRMWRTESYVNA